MATTVSVNVPLNRVEGDLEIRAELADSVVVNAWCSGTMYRGFEGLLKGRGPLDGLVITPRICGICSTSHLSAAARALDMVSGATPPPDAVAIRNVALMTEHVQSDLRQAFLMYAPDLANPRHSAQPLYDEAVRRYQPLVGESAVEVIKATKKALEIIAIVGGQWPHSSFIVPGGIVSVPSSGDLVQCRLLVRRYRAWYERQVLGCALERWLAVDSADALDEWLDESPRHHDSDLGFFIRYARAIGLDAIGGGHGRFVSFGSLDLPDGTAVRAPRGDNQLVPAGVADADGIASFDQSEIAEHVAASWFVDYEGGRHPFAGETRPYATGGESGKYSWAKAPRYAGQPAETGPLAEAMVAGAPLFHDLVARGGPSAFVRQLARIVRPASLLAAMSTWLDEVHGEAGFYSSPGEITDGQGFGLVEAARGALGHWVRIENGAIESYQIITPTAWNASPRDSEGVRGPMEEALVGTPVADPGNPVELGHVVRSFDPCLVCTVHAVSGGRSRGRSRVGLPW